MTGAIIVIVLCALLASAAAYLAWRLGRNRRRLKDPAALFLETFPPEHPRYCAMVRQTLSAADAEFLTQRVPSGPRRRARAARRRVGLEFLALLRRDYRKLDQLARVLNARSPDSGAQPEWHRLRLVIHFQLLYGLVWLKLQSGTLPEAQLRVLANRIGGLASRLEAAMHAWQDASLAAGADRVRV